MSYQYQLLPSLSPEEYADLKASIAERGVQVPVEFDEKGNILDGHHRLQACAELGIKDYPSIVRVGMTEEQKNEHVLDLNLNRRHLSKEQRKELVFKLRAIGWSTRKIAERLDVDAKTVRNDLATGEFSPVELPARVVGMDGKSRPATMVRHNDYEVVATLADGSTNKRCKTCGNLWNADIDYCPYCRYTPQQRVDFMREQQRQRQQPSIFSQTTRERERALNVIDNISEKAPEVYDQFAAGNLTVTQAQRELVKVTHKDPAPMTGKYRVIYADPPWQYGNTMPDYMGVQDDHYPTMSLDDICALPVRDIAEDNAVLFMWATSPILQESFEVLNAWGFDYKSSFIWDKVKHVMGHYNSVRHEFLLVAVRGSCQPDVHKLFDSVVTEERTEHSRKPEFFREIIDTIYPNGKRIELFSRNKVEGWDVYGNDASLS